MYPPPLLSSLHALCPGPGTIIPLLPNAPWNSIVLKVEPLESQSRVTTFVTADLKALHFALVGFDYYENCGSWHGVVYSGSWVI